MPVKATGSGISATQRNGVWTFIALLAALAFLRSLSPEYTASAIQGLVKPNISTTRSEMEELNTLREEIKRENIALQRLREELNQTSDLLKKYEELQSAGSVKEVGPADQVADDTHTVPDGKVANDMVASPVHSQDEENMDEASEDHDDMDPADGSDLTESGGETESVQLLDGECPTVISIESSKAGLGTQIEHVLSLLSVSFAIQNACVVLPPINAHDAVETFRPVAFREIFDENEFLGTGVRMVPLSVCKTSGVSHVFDDRGAESAIVKNFAAFVHEIHPKLAEESVLVHKQSKGHRFENTSFVRGDVTIMAKYISEKSGDQDGRKCIGFGRMRAEVAINLDILEHLRPAPAIAEYVSFKYPGANEAMFVKLRWNKSFCENTRTEPGTVCMFSDNILPTEEYVRSIAYTAQQAEASSLYVSMPAFVPDDVSEYIHSNLKVLEPVLLDVDGDFFTANLIEHELAVRSKVFVPDGGAWGDTVQLLRSTRNSVHYRNGFNSKLMVQEWKDAGWPADSHFLMQQSASVETQVPGFEQTEDGDAAPAHASNDSVAASEDDRNEQQEQPTAVDVHNSAVETDNSSPQIDGQSNADNHVQYAPSLEHRPDQYIPPQGYIPNEDSENHILLNARSSSDKPAPAEPITVVKSAEIVPHGHGEPGTNDVLSGSQPPLHERSALPNTMTQVTQDAITRVDLPVAAG